MSLRTVRLYGRLGAQFGRVHALDLDSRTPAEAFQALCSQHPGLQAYLTNAGSRGEVYAVFVGKMNIGRDRLDFPANDDIRIAPILRGSKRAGVLQTIVGAVLVVVGSVATVTNFYGGSAWGPYLTQAGIGLMAGGIIQMLTPMPRGIHAKDRGASEASYNFNGPVNTQAQGNPVPYFAGGPMKIGSCVISAGIDTLDTSTYAPGSGPGHMGGGGGCVATESYLPDGRRAAQVEVGETLGLVDALLRPSEGTVGWSETRSMPCVRVTTSRGVTLVCSTSAPIPTVRGDLVLAPDLKGCSVPVFDGEWVGYDYVADVEFLGDRAVQHISVEDGCFLAGEQRGRYIAHHNKAPRIVVE